MADELNTDSKILIFIETDKKEISQVSLEIIAHVANSFKESQINALLLCDEENKENYIQKLQNKGLDNLYISVSPKFSSYSSQIYTAAVSSFLNHNPQNVFLVGATPQGRELAPRVAARNDLGLTADCTQIEIEDGKLMATRPTYGGQLMAAIISKTTPNFATIRPGALKNENTFFEKPLNITYYDADIENIVETVRTIKEKYKEVSSDLATAQIIVAGGLGMKTKENFELIFKFAELIGAKPASSRAAVELGWAPKEMQVGQTGHTVAPKLYIALGISGAMHHLVGISNADRIIAVNTDKMAPIFESADLGIITDASVFLKTLIERLEG